MGDDHGTILSCYRHLCFAWGPLELHYDFPTHHFKFLPSWQPKENTLQP